MATRAKDEAGEVTQLIARVKAGDLDAEQPLFTLLYDELYAIAKRGLAREAQAHSWQATALVHESYLRLARRAGFDFADRQHFLRVAARVMRRLIVDHARANRSQKRGGDRERVPLDAAIAQFEATSGGKLQELDKALRELESHRPSFGRIVELRYFGGCTIDEVADILTLSPPTIARRWDFARAWLRARLEQHV